MRAPQRALVAFALCMPACTLIVSKDGLVGPPFVEGHDASSDDGGSALSDGGEDAITADGPSDASADTSDGAPVTIYANQGAPTGITVDATNVYWIAGTPVGMFAAPKAGGGAIKHLDDANQPLGDVFDLAVDDTYVYWTQRTGPNAGTVWRRLLAGGDTYLNCFKATNAAAYIALVNGVAFVTDFQLNGTGNVVRGQCGGAAVLYSNQSRASGVAATSSLVYWGRNQNDQIAFGPTTSGGTASVFHVAVGAVGGVAIDKDAVYWLRESRRVMRFTFSTQIETELFDEGAPFGDGDIAVDDEAIYWSEAANGVIKRMLK
jgi:hypothetical protein